MAFRYLQFKVAATTTNLATQVSASVAPGAAPARVPAYSITIQNNAGHDIRVGDSTASVTNNIGYLLKTGQTPPDKVTFGPFQALSEGLEQIFISGTQNDLIDVIYVK